MVRVNTYTETRQNRNNLYCERARKQSSAFTVKINTSDYVLLGAAFLSFLFSVYLWFSGHRDEGMFVGIWVPSILSFGVYFRLATRGN